MKYNYSKICKSLLNDTQPRAKEVIERRFGLTDNSPETLEAIGKDFQITRERVRQIQSRAIKQIKQAKATQLSEIFSSFSVYITKNGGVVEQGKIIEDWGGEENKNQILFLLNLNTEFKFCTANKDFYAFWSNDDKAIKAVKNEVSNFIKFLKTKKVPVALGEFESIQSNDILRNYISLSYHILTNKEGKYGLSTWPEVNPRNIRDKAYLALKKGTAPLHFSEIYGIITKEHASVGKNILLQSVHNELIRNTEFVLIGRGIYALKEWGYEPGWVKDILAETLRKEKNGLDKDILIERVLSQRKVKKSTILLNLTDKNYFLRDDDGKYILKA